MYVLYMYVTAFDNTDDQQDKSLFMCENFKH